MKSGKGASLGLAALLALAAAFRLLGVTRPLLGNFATKNVVYGMIARNWARGETSATRPMLDLLVGGGPSMHLLEIPLSAYLAGALWSLFGGSLDMWGRLTTIAFSVGSVGLMFLLVRRWHGASAAWAASLVLAFSPVSVIYGQSFMLEASVVFFTLATLLCWSRWLERQSAPWLGLATLSFAALLLTKIYMLVLALPLAAMLFWSPRGAGRPGALRSWAWALLAIVLAAAPAACWYWQAFQISSPDNPLAARLYYSVRKSAAAHPMPHPLLRMPGFYSRALDNLTGVTLTPIAFTLALFGFAQRDWKRHAPWLVSMLVLCLALPLKFHEMNYYYLVILPPLCVMAGLGWQWIYESVRPSRWVCSAVLGVFLILCAVFSQARFYHAGRGSGGSSRGCRCAIAHSRRQANRYVAWLNARLALLLRPPRLGALGRIAEPARHIAGLPPPRRKVPGCGGIGPTARACARALESLASVRQGPGFAVYELP